MADDVLTAGLPAWGSDLAALKIRDHLNDRPITKVQLMPGVKAFPGFSE